jgi:hypothetical protein
MPCEDCNANFENEIGSCPPFANRDDVIRIFTENQEACCVGEIGLITQTSPASSMAAANAAIAEAFENGVDNCNCPCKYIVDTVNDALYVNCTSDLSDPNNWNDLTNDCISNLTTIGLDPSSDPVAALAEGFPLGISVHCETAILFREDGTECYSVDFGATWVCGSDGVGGLFTSNQERTASSSCAGCGVAANPRCSNNHTLFPRMWDVGAGDDEASGVNETSSTGGVLLDCAICSFGGLDNDFKVSQNGNYKLTFYGTFTGAFAGGSVGCAGCNLTGTNGGVFRFRDGSGAILYQSSIGGIQGQNNKQSTSVTVEFYLPLLASEEYHVQIFYTGIPTACCDCDTGNNIDHRGRWNSRGIAIVKL